MQVHGVLVAAFLSTMTIYFTDNKDQDFAAVHVPDLIWGNCSSGITLNTTTE